MKKIFTVTISENLQQRIAGYGNTAEYLNKKADFADALGFVASNIGYGKDTDKWQLIATLLSEHQQDIDLYHQEAIQEE